MYKNVVFLLFLVNLNLVCQDSIVMKQNSILFNPGVDWPAFNKITLIDTNYKFNGYLVVKIDSSTYFEKSLIDTTQFLLNTNVFWVDSLSDIFRITSTYQYTIAFNLLFDQAEYPPINSDTNLISFLKSFPINYCINEKIFLYDYNGILTTDSLIMNGTLWQKGKDSTLYIIYKCKFNTAILKYVTKGNEVLVFLPTSSLFEFRTITELEANINGLEKSRVKIAKH